MANKPEIFDETPAAEYLGMSVAFMRAGRSKGVVGNGAPPPPHLKLGRAVKYLRSDLDAWLAARRVDPLKRKATAA